MAKNPLSPTAASEAPDQLFPADAAALQEKQTGDRVASLYHTKSASEAATTGLSTPTLKTTQSYELIQRYGSMHIRFDWSRQSLSKSKFTISNKLNSF